MRLSRRLVPGTLLGVAVLITACSSTSGSGSTSPSSTSESSPASTALTKHLRDVRYCEVIPSIQQASTITTYVYNTLGYNFCPPQQWNALTEQEVNSAYGSQSAKLNGPRHFVMDEIQSLGGTSSSTKTFTFGGIEFGLKATLTTPAGQPTVGDQFYAPNEVSRDTIFTYHAGKPAFELTGPDGSVLHHAVLRPDRRQNPHVFTAFGTRQQARPPDRLELQERYAHEHPEPEQQRFGNGGERQLV